MNLLFACNAGINRSRAFARIFPKDSRYIGLDFATKEELHFLANWADRIYIFETVQAKFFRGFEHKLINLRLPDVFEYDHGKLLETS